MILWNINLFITFYNIFISDFIYRAIFLFQRKCYTDIEISQIYWTLLSGFAQPYENNICKQIIIGKHIMFWYRCQYGSALKQENIRADFLEKLFDLNFSEWIGNHCISEFWREVCTDQIESDMMTQGRTWYDQKSM